MARKHVNSDDLDLSLTGSQFSTPVSSARRPGSAKGTGPKRPGSAGATREKGSPNLSNGYTGAKKGTSSGRGRQRTSSTGSYTPKSPAARNRGDGEQRRPDTSGSKPSARDDFLALFESGPQPKIMKPKQARKTSTPHTYDAWAIGGSNALGSARSVKATDTLADNDHLSQTTSTHKYQHSIFPLSSARSSSTVDNEDYENRNLNVLPQRTGSKEDLHRSRNSVHDEAEILNSQRCSSSKKSQNLNSIANNMTSQAMSPGTKTALSDIENSYQNIKPKTPVNQVRQPSSVPAQVGKNVAEDYIKTVNMAATRIQRWFRRHNTRRKSGQAAMRRLLDAKRQEKEQELKHEREQERDRRPEEERKRMREERARQARQHAIQELHKKREEKRVENQKKVEEEMTFLQASGKVSKTPAHKSNVKKKMPTKSRPRQSHNEARSSSDSEPDQRPEQRPGTGGADRRLEDFFQDNPLNSAPNNGAANNLALAEDGAEEAHEDQPLETPSQAATRTTLNDLMETLKLLEQEEKLPSARNGRNEKPANWLDDLDKASGDKDDIYLSADHLEKLNPSKENLKRSGLLTEDKLKSIISFLDEVETADRLEEVDQELSRVNENLERPALLVPSSEEIAQMEQATAAASEVTNTVLSQKLELEEKKRTVQMLQKALNQQRELTVRHAKETEKEMKKRLDVQKDEYEETIKRHLSFIDQLIDDKKGLGERCEHLVKELKGVDKKYNDRIQQVTEKHDLEMRKLKEVHAAAEKLRREKWIDEKTKKIKEMTVKGLEPEIQRLIAKHKAEIKKLKSIHEAELLESDERAGQRYVKMTEELRDQLAKEKETACQRERDLARQTYEKQMQQEEEAYQGQRRRMYSEIQEEKERLAAQAARQRAELDKLQRQLEDAHSKTSEATRREYEKAREEQERRHAAEMKQLKDQLQVEKEAWEENYKKKQETWLAAKERELREQVRRDRDKEIELVIGRLEEDSQVAREDMDRAAENRIRRTREKYESQIAELEKSERNTTAKYNETKAKLAEVEGENERQKVVLRQKDKEIAELKKLLEKLNEERDRVSDVIRQEFADRLVATEEENKRVKNEMSELKARHRLELERSKTEVEIMTKAKEEEMEEVHKRVKQAIVKKEEVVTQLRQQYQAALKRADHLEGLLDQQRKQLLGKK